jgi:NADH-quinone oxidoreductase subunit J
LEISQIIFYLLGAFILGMAFLAVTSAKIFRSAIWLLFSLIGIAGLYFWMEMEFIAAVQIIVYVGGIVVLIIFSIFLTQDAALDMPKPTMGRRIAAALAVLFGIAFTGSLVYNHGFQPSTVVFDNEVARIGRQLLNTGEGGFILPFEAVSMLLLAAMVGCIVIAMRSEGKDKVENKKVKDEIKVEIENAKILGSVQ